MGHIAMIESTPAGYLGICETCGDRGTEFTGYGEAEKWVLRHEELAKSGRLHTGPLRQSAKTALRLYRERSESIVYTPEERAQWTLLADGLAEHIRRFEKRAVIEGQMPLFETSSE